MEGKRGSECLLKPVSDIDFNPDVTEEGTGNKGTYKVSGDNLEIDLNGQKMTATLSDDKNSFTIDSAPGLAALASGTKYTKAGK
ncbi:hypothetical protein [Lactiplantibacillus paraxiangfangensis]|uniref:hypothetical protein n=1 Tax=Lactiplantibacillus paraxiangfangensis TaxID=3076224 RepID=UPI0030C73EF6